MPRKNPPKPKPKPGTTTTTATGYGITYHGNKPPVPGYAMGHQGADAAAGNGNVYQSQGMQPNYATGGVTKPIDQQFWWSPDKGGWETMNHLTPNGGPGGGLPTTPPGGGGGGGGGGGRGSGVSPAANFAAYAQAYMQLLNSDKYKPQKNPLSGMIPGAYGKDIAEATAAYNGIASKVPMNNPFLGLIAQQAPTVDPGMQAFLQGQGVGTGDYSNAVNYANAQLGAGNQNWQNLGAVLGQNHLAAQQGTVDLAHLQGQNVVQGLQADQQAALNAVAMQDFQAQQAYQQQQQNALMQLLGTALQSGAKMPSLGGLV